MSNTMSKPQNLPVKGIPVKKSKIELYQESLINILLGLTHANPVVLFADQLVKSSTILVFTPLSGYRLKQLANFANSWNQELMIGRGQLGSIKIEFNLNQN